MNFLISLIKTLAESGPFKGDLDYHLVRASMVLIFLLFGYTATSGNGLRVPTPAIPATARLRAL
jgi:hypothetical protein